MPLGDECKWDPANRNGYRFKVEVKRKNGTSRGGDGLKSELERDRADRIGGEKLIEDLEADQFAGLKPIDEIRG